MSTINSSLNKPPRSAGRPPGVKNKTSLKRVAEFLLEVDKNPVEEILKLMSQLEPKEQSMLWLHLLKYVEAPQIPKPVDDNKVIQIVYNKPENYDNE